MDGRILPSFNINILVSIYKRVIRATKWHEFYTGAKFRWPHRGDDGVCNIWFMTMDGTDHVVCSQQQQSNHQQNLGGSRWILLWVIGNFLTEHDDFFWMDEHFYNLHFFSVGTHFRNWWPFFQINENFEKHYFLMHEDFESANIFVGELFWSSRSLFIFVNIVLKIHEHVLNSWNLCSNSWIFY